MSKNILAPQDGSNLAEVVFPHSVTDRVLQGANCPVLLIRANPEA